MADIIDSTNIIDIRDVIARVEELRGTALKKYIIEGDQNPLSHEQKEELKSLEALLEECKGRGGDEQWEGDWYPTSLIRDSYFHEAMDELVEECYTLPKDLPFWMTITYDYEALKQDYTSVKFNGVTYWCR